MSRTGVAPPGSGVRPVGSIRERRLAAGLTQRELARAAGVGVGVIRDLEQGVTLHPRPESLLRLAAALGAGRGLATPRPPAGHRGRHSPWCAILGPLQIRGSGGKIGIGGPRQRAVLGLLALHPNEVVRREAIVDALWGDEPPASAMTMIQSHVSALRRVLPSIRNDGRSVLVTAVSGYQLCLADDELDLKVFMRLASQALAAGDAVRAFGLYGQALALWRGDPLADVDLLQAHPAVAGLRALLAATVIDYAGTAGSQAEHDKALPLLRALTTRDPLNEHAQARLMTTLAVIGQQAAALEVFEHVRRRLDDDLGVRPGAELADAHLRVLRGALPAGRPAAGLARTGPRGARLRAASQTADGQGPPDGKTASGRAVPAPCQLPATVPDFTGRSAELRALAEILAPPDMTGVPVAAICGLPGSGKTSLAVRAAHQLRPLFPDGQLWVQLDGASARPRQPADVLGEVLRTLGVHGSAIPDALAEKAAAYRSLVADRRILLVADDACSAEQVSPLIPGTTGSAVIATSRTQLAELPGARVLPLDLLGQADAVALLARIVGAERVAAEPADAENLVGACGRLPLAVRIAGTRLAGRPAWPVSLMSQSLADQQRRLDVLAAGSLSVRASLAMSYQAIDERAQRALCLLGMLGPTDVAEWVVGALLGIADASEVVNRLADSSLLTPTGPDATGLPRYRLHDLLRDFAVERLADDYEGERDAAFSRALQAWLQLASLADSALPREPYFPPPAAENLPSIVPEKQASRVTANPLAWFSAERLNLLTAVEHSCAAGDYQLATRLATRVAACQHIQARPDDSGRMWSLIFNAAQRAEDSIAAAQAELRLATAMCSRGKHAEAAPIIDWCARTFEKQADPRSLANAIYWQSSCHLNLGSFDAARRSARRALELARRTAEHQTEFLALRLLAIAEANLPDCRDKAIKSSQEALTAVRKFDQPAWELEVMHTAAHVNNLLGRYQEAIEGCHDALELHRRLGVAVDKGGWLGIMSDAYYGLGRYQAAVETLLTAFPIFRDHFMRRHQALCLLKLGYAYQAMGDYGQAITSVAESLPIFRELRLAHYEERALRTVDDCRRQMQSTVTPAHAHATRLDHQVRSTRC